VKAVRSYMNEEISAFQFDGALTKARNATDDKTPQTIARCFWFHYDDCKDHKMVASKEEWDFFNRLLLLLESGGEIETVRSCRQWRLLQAVAALFFLTFLLIAVQTGWGDHLIGFALPFGPPSLLLAWLNSRRRNNQIHPRERALAPFPSVSSLLAVRRRVRSFARRLYPKAIAGRRIRDPIIYYLMWIQWSIAWCMFSPVVLFFQMLPEPDLEIRIRMS